MLRTMSNSLDDLVDDVVIQILQFLSPRAILSLRKTSRRYYLLSKLHSVWHTRFRIDVLACNIPAPGLPRSLCALSAAELERRTLRALYLHRAWPHLSAKTFFAHRRQVDQVAFIPGGTEVLTVRDDVVEHWLLAGPGGQGWRHVAEWRPIQGVPCRIVKDAGMPGVIAVGPRKPVGSHRFAKVLITSVKAPFTMLCDYALVPGVVVGVWRHLLVLDTTNENEGGVELLDWHAQTTGTVLLPCFPELFGSFLDFVVFDRHVVVVCERCMCVFPIPHVPASGQMIVEHNRVFMFQEAICRPVGFTTCVTRSVQVPDINLGLDGTVGCERMSSSLISGIFPPLTIVAPWKRQAGTVSMTMLVPLVDNKGAAFGVDAFPYRIIRLPPPVLPSFLRAGPGGGIRDPVCTNICLGSSGRGLFVVGGELRLVSPNVLFLPPYDMQFGPVFETEKPLYVRDVQGDLDRSSVGDENTALMDVWDGDEEQVDRSGDKVDFDEGTGRFVVARERGGFEVVQLE